MIHNSLSAVSRRSVERPFLVIAANIPHMRSVLQGVGAPLEGTTDILCHHHDHSPEYCCGALVFVPDPGSGPLASAAGHALLPATSAVLPFDVGGRHWPAIKTGSGQRPSHRSARWVHGCDRGWWSASPKRPRPVAAFAARECGRCQSDECVVGPVK